MPVYTYQLAIKDGERWCREYVCAEDRVTAVYQFLEDNPFMTLESLLQADELEVERCA